MEGKQVQWETDPTYGALGFLCTVHIPSTRCHHVVVIVVALSTRCQLCMFTLSVAKCGRYCWLVHLTLSSVGLDQRLDKRTCKYNT